MFLSPLRVSPALFLPPFPPLKINTVAPQSSSASGLVTPCARRTLRRKLVPARGTCSNLRELRHGPASGDAPSLGAGGARAGLGAPREVQTEGTNDDAEVPPKTSDLQNNNRTA